MKFATLTLACSAAPYAFPAVAHHSFAMFDANKTITLQGTVKQFEWTNPHSWILLNVANAHDQPEEWTIEAGAPAGLVRQGWGPKTLTPGMKVAATIHPLKDGTHGGQFLTVKLPRNYQVDVCCRLGYGLGHRSYPWPTPLQFKTFSSASRPTKRVLTT